MPNIKNKVIEKKALKKGLIVENEKGAVYFIDNTGRPVGFDLEYLKMAKPRSKGSKHTHAGVLFLMAKEAPKSFTILTEDIWTSLAHVS
ncbi:hypothetical protein [Bacillus sp. FSL M8-0077]|uniref:hypothetical protein n=1 Tax=Bacillus sp. FSL M8-0077 TaxID=2954556 RepID=UPI0030FDCB4F